MAFQYNILADYGKATDDKYVTTSPYWVIAVIRVGLPLTFSRAKKASVSTDVSAGSKLRADRPLIITGDCVSLSVSNSLNSQTKTLNARLIQTDVNYLVEILPGDWVFSWMMNNRGAFDSLITRLEALGGTDSSKFKPCNGFYDGLKFVGRVHSIRKTLNVDRNSGTKSSAYSLQCVSFEELNTKFYYDWELAEDVADSQTGLGAWLCKIGLTLNDLFKTDAETGVPEGNINMISMRMLNLIVGKGPPKHVSPSIATSTGDKISATSTTDTEAPYAYIIPEMVGLILGKEASEPSKIGAIMAYADILELLQGVQQYSGTEQNPTSFTPDLDDSKSTSQRKITTVPLLGTFLPTTQEYTNQPLWSLFKRFSNPTINEMYTCLRVNNEGRVVPTIVFRQIPNTTAAFNTSYEVKSTKMTEVTLPEGAYGPIQNISKDVSTTKSIAVTRFLDVPRWVIPASLIDGQVDIGRSNGTRTNFIHVYGSSAQEGSDGMPVNFQMLNNPPIRDDLDIQRNGLCPHMSTVECYVSNHMGSTPGVWMSLIADWLMGSQFTLNGTITTVGIQSPIVEGDNLEFDGVVYRIESVSHNAGIDSAGNKSFSTTMTLTNGMRANGTSDIITDTSGNIYPIYPGFDKQDNTLYDPGLTLDGHRTSGGNSDGKSILASMIPASSEKNG